MASGLDVSRIFPAASPCRFIPHRAELRTLRSHGARKRGGELLRDLINPPLAHLIQQGLILLLKGSHLCPELVGQSRRTRKAVAEELPRFAYFPRFLVSQ